MGLLVEGEWKDKWYDTKESGGEFRRPTTTFRESIGETKDAAGNIKYPAEKGRYHLYVAEACPWAHRTLLFRQLKGLEDHITVSVVQPRMPDETGWTFGHAPYDDEVLQSERLAQVYVAADSKYTGRVTVPVLWDKKTGTIVNNESAEIIRQLNSAFDAVGAKDGDYYPDEFADEIDAVNHRVYDDVNNGVYKCGFATTQDAYDKAFRNLFATLDWLDDRLGNSRYLVGDRITEADWRLFTTLVRFDAVYFTHFKCNLRRISDYPHLSGYLRELYQTPGVAQTVNLDAIKEHYFWSHTTVNPHRIIANGPELDFESPHGRDGVGKS